MRLGIVGGPERAEETYRSLASRSGVELEYHSGNLAGRGTTSLDALVQRSDFVVVITGTNSHAAVWRARKQSKHLGRPCLLVSHFGTARMSALIADLEQRWQQQPTGTGRR
jgi:hypothetical protein